MIYPDNFEEKLRFGLVRQVVKDYCLTPQGAEKVDQMHFSTDFDEVSLRVNETAEMLSILSNEPDFPAEEFPDLREGMARIRVDGLYLEEAELAALCMALILVRQTVRFFETRDEKLYPSLRQRAADVAVYPVLIERIERILDKHGRIRDNASAELANIRREMSSVQSNVSRRLASILKQAQTDGIVEADASVTVRDGRTVIPVPAANKRRINGIVLDESSTGRTSFIEPAEVVALNNQLRELGYAERREIIKILTDISASIRPYSDEVLFSIDFLAHLDFVKAKARYALATDSICPVFENRQGFYWHGARHPLLFLQLKAQSKPIVPLDIELEAPLQRILIISGPNAGGKSVCLQTVGILQYMFQCGMLVPLDDGSKMGFFERIFIDMGDEQSIENDLSTYSSHLNNMKNFLRHANSRTLILIDEFGTGTEPTLGGAIAESVLAELNRKEVFGVVTTHYTNLKHFAAQTEGIHNGAMQFDTHAIKPLFRLQMGQPGSSFAFEIARKIGLPESILADAKEKMGQEHLDYDKHLREIVRDKNYWEQKRQSIKENEKRLAEVLERYNQALQNIRKERHDILEKAREQSRTLLSETNKRIENTISEIRTSQADKEKTRAARAAMEQFKAEAETKFTPEDDDHIERQIQKIKDRENRKKNRAKKGSATSETVEEKKPLEVVVGSLVSIDGNASQTGEVLKINGKEALVAVGNLQTTVKVDRLTVVSNSAMKKQKRVQVVVGSNVGDAVREKKLNFKPELDVRGLRTDEAIEQVSAFLDEAIMCEQPRLSILHGKGNGILRQMIRQYLNSQPFVESVHDEHVQFGGAGITIVELK